MKSSLDRNEANKIRAKPLTSIDGFAGGKRPVWPSRLALPETHSIGSRGTWVANGLAWSGNTGCTELQGSVPERRTSFEPKWLRMIWYIAPSGRPRIQ